MAQRKTIALLLTVLLATPAWAQSSPLPPGRPAGAGPAQFDDNATIFVGVGVLVVGVGVYLASGTYKIPGSGAITPPPPVATPTTTAH